MAQPRGCGVRQAGGIYVETKLSEHGRPLEEFLIDYPHVLDTLAMGISAQGVHIREVNGVFHVFDVVGAEHYPNVADFLEETRRMGLSRRVQRNADFDKLTPNSRIFLAHRRAWIDNAMEYVEHAHDYTCPKRLDTHAPLPLMRAASPARMCLGLTYHDLDTYGTAPTSLTESPCCVGLVERDMPAFSYQAHLRPENVEPRYRTALFLGLPISNIAVIRDPSDRSNEARSLAAAKRARLAITLEDS